MSNTNNARTRTVSERITFEEVKKGEHFTISGAIYQKKSKLTARAIYPLRFGDRWFKLDQLVLPM